MNEQFFDVGQKVEYEHGGQNYEHVIHGVRYQEEKGVRHSVSYLVGLEFHEHDIPVPAEVYHKEGKTDEINALRTEMTKRIHAGKEVKDLQAKFADLHETSQDVVQARIKAVVDSHEHDIKCPVEAREVPHNKVIRAIE